MRIQILDKLALKGETGIYAFLLTENENIDATKKLAIFGAGDLGYNLNNSLQKRGETAVFFDNDSNKIGRKLSGVEVLSPQLIKQDPHNYFIIIALVRLDCMYWVTKQLLNYGVDKQNIAFCIVVDTLDFDLLNDNKYMNAALESFSDAYYNVPLVDIRLPSPGLTSWVKSFEFTKNLCKWIIHDSTGKEKVRILEIGPGIGIQSIMLAKILNADITWIDVHAYDCIPEEYDAGIVSHLNKKYNIKLIEGNIETIKCDFDEGFDVILFSQVLEHLYYHPVQTMEKLMSWLNPNGKLYLGTPDVKYFRNGPGLRYYDSWRDMPLYGENRLSKVADYDCGGHQFEYHYEEAIDLFNELNLNVERAAKSWSNCVMEFTLAKKN